MNDKLSPLDDALRALGETAARPMEKAISLPPMLYWRDDVALLETERIFRRDWVCTGLAAELPEFGDYLSFSIAGEPIFCIRDAAAAIRSFSNVCRHRMMRLVDGHGRAKRIICPYHAWTYDLGGRLIGAPHMKGSAVFDRADICLPEIRTEIWQGWIYVTLNAEAERLINKAPSRSRSALHHRETPAFPCWEPDESQHRFPSPRRSKLPAKSLCLGRRDGRKVVEGYKQRV